MYNRSYAACGNKYSQIYHCRNKVSTLEFKYFFLLINWKYWWDVFTSIHWKLELISFYLSVSIETTQNKKVCTQLHFQLEIHLCVENLLYYKKS